MHFKMRRGNEGAPKIGMLLALFSRPRFCPMRGRHGASLLPCPASDVPSNEPSPSPTLANACDPAQPRILNGVAVSLPCGYVSIPRLNR
jgi:hypothetical protein